MVIGEHYERTMTPYDKHEFTNHWNRQEWQIFMKDEDGKLYFTFTTSKTLANKILRNMNKPVRMTFRVRSHSTDWNADVINDIIFK